jgi:hypothetical protein
VAAYSTARALYAGYDGPLYQVQRASDGATADIGLLTNVGVSAAAGAEQCCPEHQVFRCHPMSTAALIAPGVDESAPSSEPMLRRSPRTGYVRYAQSIAASRAGRPRSTRPGGTGP